MKLCTFSFKEIGETTSAVKDLRLGAVSGRNQDLIVDLYQAYDEPATTAAGRSPLDLPSNSRSYLLNMQGFLEGGEVARNVAAKILEGRHIHPNVDYATGPIYHMMGFDTDFFTPIFVISRITGWSAHIMEQHTANKLIRPLSKYSGEKHRKVMLLNQR